METPDNTLKVDAVQEKESLEQISGGQDTVPVQKKSLPNKLILIGGIIIFLLVGGGLYLYSKSASVLQTPKQIPQTNTQTVFPKPQPTLPRSKAPGIVVSLVTAKGIDSKTGEAVNPTSVFLTTDKSIYAVTTLSNAKIGTRIEYVRYFNNKFLDNGSLPVTKLTTNNISFVWTLKKARATHPVGNYKIKVYTNGIFEKETSYSVQ